MDDIKQKQIDYFNDTCSEIARLTNEVFNLNITFDPIVVEEPSTYNSWYNAYLRDVSDQIKSKYYDLFGQLSAAHIVKSPLPFATLDSIYTDITNTLKKLQKY